MLISTLLMAQEEEEREFTKLKVYLDCAYCDMSYLIQEMYYIDFVRSPQDADVYVIVRTQQTGSGGTSYQLEYTGQKTYEHISNQFGFSTQSTNTPDEIREELRDAISIGLSTYWSQLGRREYEERKKIESGEIAETDEKEEEVKDPWNNWVFNVGVNGQMSGEESSKRNNYGFNFSSKQVTEKHKFYLSARYDNNDSEYSFGPTKITSEKSTKSLRVKEAISLTDHWSVGAFVDMGSSDYSNKDFYVSVKPAIEYSLFPYEEASKKQITLSYEVGQIYNDYKERTIFNKTSERRWEQSINLSASATQKWGNVDGLVSYNLMLDETSLYAFDFSLGCSIRLLKGLSMNLRGNYQITRNQINISAGGVSQDELLLRQKQIQSGYNYYTTIGFSYSFGSMFNTVVNPRFGF